MIQGRITVFKSIFFKVSFLKIKRSKCHIIITYHNYSIYLSINLQAESKALCEVIFKYGPYSQLGVTLGTVLVIVFTRHHCDKFALPRKSISPRKMKKRGR